MANVFKLACEVAIILTLNLAVLLKIDLSSEDVSESFIGVMLIFANVVLPVIALVSGILICTSNPPSRQQPARTVVSRQLQLCVHAFRRFYLTPMHCLYVDGGADLDRALGLASAKSARIANPMLQDSGEELNPLGLDGPLDGPRM